MQRNRILFAALIVAIAVLIAYLLASDAAYESRVASRDSRYVAGPTTTVPPVTEPPAEPPTTEPPATEVPVSRHTRTTESQQQDNGDDSAAWHCLAVLESGNGTASRNIYGIQSSRVYGMSRDEQLAWARSIRDAYGSYLVGWPNTGRECGLS